MKEKHNEIEFHICFECKFDFDKTQPIFLILDILVHPLQKDS